MVGVETSLKGKMKRRGRGRKTTEDEDVDFAEERAMEESSRVNPLLIVRASKPVVGSEEE